MSGSIFDEAAPPEDEWPILVPLDTYDLPRLDATILPAWAGNFAAALAISTETPPELAVGMVLAACATAAARRFKVQVKDGYEEPCNLWVVVALAPGNRKSSVQGAACAPLAAWEHDQAVTSGAEIKRIASQRKTQEARARELRNKAAREKEEPKAKALAVQAADIEADLPDIPVVPQLWTSDVTPEKLGVLLAEQDESMAWLSSEGGIFDQLRGRYSNGIPNLDLVLKAHSGDQERVDRGSRPAVYLRNPSLSIGLSPQPEVLHGLAADPAFRARGLLARFIYFLPPSPLGSRTLESAPVPPAVRDAYEAGLRALLAQPAAPEERSASGRHRISLSGEAYQLWHTASRAIEAGMLPDGDFEHCTDWAGKAPGAAARIAGVLHAITHAHGDPSATAISADTMDRALTVLGVASHHSRAVLDLMGTDPNVAAARTIWRWIERGRRARFEARDAFEGNRSLQRMEKVNAALAVLQERGYLEVMPQEPKGGPGRPRSPTVRVRPDIVRTWA